MKISKCAAVNEQELRDLFESNKKMLHEWGKLVTNEIIKRLNESEVNQNEILKIPPIPRVKDVVSFIDKALYREKAYEDPYWDITDKVGVRFVVLSTDEIEIIEKCVIENTDMWEYSKDKDYESEKNESPEYFTYQSVHYVVKCREDIELPNCTIEAGTTCEIQIRTLLQHAYAELSHDVAYKKKEKIPPDISRKLARSMALIEASDELFKEVQNMIKNNDIIFNDYIAISKELLKFDILTPMNKLIFNAYRDTIDQNQISPLDIKNFANQKSYLIDKVREKATLNLIFKQPIVWLIYYLVFNHKFVCKDQWPLEDQILRPFFVDLGMNMETM